MKPIGVFQKTRLIVQDVLLLCFLLLLTPAYWTLLFLNRSLIAISCLTLQCVRVTNALLKKTVGATWRLLTVINRNSRRRHLRRKAVSISGT